MAQFGKNLLVIGTPGMVYRLNAFLYAFSSEKFKGSLCYFSFRKGSRVKRVLTRPIDWCLLTAQIFLADTILVAAACHHSRQGRWAIRLGNWLRKTIIVDFYISHYETRVLDRKMYASDSVEAKRFYQIDRYALLSSDICLFLNQAECNYYCSALDIDPSVLNVEILPVTNDHLFTPAKLPWHTGATDVPVFAWWGREVSNPIHGLDAIITHFIKEKNDARLVLCLDSEKDRGFLMKKYHQLHNHDRIELRTDLFFSNGSLPDFLQNKVDFAIGPIGQSTKAKTVLANKFVDALFMGLPIYCQVSEGMNDLLPADLIQQLFEVSVNDNQVGFPPPQKIDVLKYQQLCRLAVSNTFTLKSFAERARSVFSEK